jgi:hypothetical protein
MNERNVMADADLFIATPFKRWAENTSGIAKE